MERVCPSEVPLGYTFSDVKGLMSYVRPLSRALAKPKKSQYGLPRVSKPITASLDHFLGIKAFQWEAINPPIGKNYA